MRRKYTRFPLDNPHPAFRNETAVWLPILSVRAGSAHLFTPRLQAIVDSGSPHCMFHAGIAEYLNVKLEGCVEHSVGGIISGPQESIYFHRVKLQIESDWTIEVVAGFVKKLAFTAILGRNGFFDNFHVHFDHSKNPPELEVSKIERQQ